MTIATSCLPHTVSAEHGTEGRCDHCVATPMPGYCASPCHAVHLPYLSLCITPVSDCTLPPCHAVHLQHLKLLCITSKSGCRASPPCQVVCHPMPGAPCRGFPASPRSAQVHPNHVPSSSPFLLSHCPNPAPYTECCCLYPLLSVILPAVATGYNCTPVQIAVSTPPGEADGAITNPSQA